MIDTEKRGRKMIWGVTLSFVIPLVLAMVFFQWVLNFGATSTTNYGQLISPVRNVASVDDENDAFRGKWSYVVFAKQCSKQCAEQLKVVETVRVLSHKNMRRVQTIFVTTEPLRDEFMPDNVKVSKINSIIVDEKRYLQMKEQFAENENVTYLVDPQGMAMMAYPPDKRDVKSILRDLKRLLKYSRIG